MSMIDEYIHKITELLKQTEDAELLDLVYKLLCKSL